MQRACRPGRWPVVNLLPPEVEPAPGLQETYPGRHRSGIRRWEPWHRPTPPRLRKRTRSSGTSSRLRRRLPEQCECLLRFVASLFFLSLPGPASPQRPVTAGNCTARCRA